jgi:hypothetical protein
MSENEGDEPLGFLGSLEGNTWLVKYPGLMMV